MKKRLLCFFCACCMLFSMTGCHSENEPVSSDVSEQLNNEDVNLFEGQTAPDVMTVPDSVSDTTMGDWLFWSTDDPYLAESVSWNEDIGNGFVVTLTQTGFQYSVHEIRNALMSDESFSDTYIFADTLHENHFSNMVQNLGGFTSYIVTSSVNGLLKEHAEESEIHEDYDDLYLALSQDFSAYVNPSGIEAQIYVEDLTAESQARVYEIIAATFGPDFAEYLVCGDDVDGLDDEGLDIMAGNRDDTVAVGETVYRFTRTLSSKDDGYVVALTGEVKSTPSESNFVYYTDSYVDAYASSPMRLSDVLANEDIEDYASDDFNNGFYEYFSNYSQSPTGYLLSLPLSMSYYEMRGNDGTTVYSTQMSMYGLGEEVTDETSKVRRMDVAYMVTLKDDDLYRLMLTMSGQTTARTMDDKELTEENCQALYQEAAESLKYFFGEDIVVSFEASDDQTTEQDVPVASFSFDAALYGGTASLSGVMAVTEQDGYRWVDWTVSVVG